MKTIEEKAKAYDKALNTAREILAHTSENYLCTHLTKEDIKEMYSRFFPELAESEDDRIRKAIHIYLDWLDGRRDYQPKGDYTIKDMIAWIEKQKEFVSADFDDVWETADCEELIATLDKYSKDAIKEMCHAWYDKGIELERRNWLEKQGEQKPAEWSEEDEVKINRIVACLENLNVADNDILLKDVDWLKSLRPQNRWKPTKQQLSELRCVISGCSFETSVLVELEKNLKKLL